MPFRMILKRSRLSVITFNLYLIDIFYRLPTKKHRWDWLNRFLQIFLTKWPVIWIWKINKTVQIWIFTQFCYALLRRKSKQEKINPNDTNFQFRKISKMRLIRIFLLFCCSTAKIAEICDDAEKADTCMKEGLEKL